MRVLRFVFNYFGTPFANSARHLQQQRDLSKDGQPERDTRTPEFLHGPSQRV